MSNTPGAQAQAQASKHACSPLSPCRHALRKAFPVAWLFDQGKSARKVKTGSP